MPPPLFFCQGCVSTRAERHPTLRVDFHFLPRVAHMGCVFHMCYCPHFVHTVDSAVDNPGSACSPQACSPPRLPGDGVRWFADSAALRLSVRRHPLGHPRASWPSWFCFHAARCRPALKAMGCNRHLAAAGLASSWCPGPSAVRVVSAALSGLAWQANVTLGC